MTAKGWSARFDDPIPLPDGGELRTLLDAGRYVDALPPSMHEREEWQAVMEVPLSAVEGREPVRLLRIALILALHMMLIVARPIGRILGACPGRSRTHCW
jgi:hypothetical protein